MPSITHSALRVESYSFRAEHSAVVTQLGGGLEAQRMMAQSAPHGITRCYIGVGGVHVDQERRRGFAGFMPSMPKLIEPELAGVYADELATMASCRREEIVFAGMVGGGVGSCLGMIGVGIGYAMDGDAWIGAIPIMLIVPCALTATLMYRTAFAHKYRRIETLYTLVEGLRYGDDTEAGQKVVALAKLLEQGQDPLLRFAARQFFRAKEAMLPRYEDPGIRLPDYAPPDDDTPLSALRCYDPPLHELPFHA